MKPTDSTEELAELIFELDEAIQLAIASPLSFVENPLLDALRASCHSLTKAQEDGRMTGMAAGTEKEKETRAALLWEVRARAGRLQMLLDSAGKFYASCFSNAQPEDMGYGVHGEMSTATGTTHLSVDC